MEPGDDRSGSSRSPALRVLLVGLGLLACAGLFSLGVWQVHRLAWKEALIARLEARLREAPAPLPEAARWPGLARDDCEYRRIAVQGRYDFDHQVLVRASTELGAGWWVLTPLRTSQGPWVLVNRGFVPPEMKAQVPQGPADASVTGLLRWSEPGGGFLQANAPAQGRWYSRDVAAIAAAQGLLGPVAPFFLDAQALGPADRSAWPRPGLTVVRFPNNHLVYALTWFAMAASLAGAIGWLLWDGWRRRRPAGALQRVD